jgi:probable O-glycosylation ligase (exosortase A-associated)
MTTSIFVILAIAVLLPLIFVKPAIGILAWFWISFMNPHRLTWGFATEFSVAMLVGVVTLLAWLLSKERHLPPANAPTVLLILLAGWITVTTLTAEMPALAWEEWYRAIKIILMTLVTICVMQTRERLHALVCVVAVGIGIYALKGGVLTGLSGGAHMVFGPSNSFITDNNALGLAIVMVLPLFRYLHLDSDVFAVRTAAAVMIGLSVIAVIGTYSRGGVLGLAAVLGLLAYKTRYRFQFLLLGAGILAVAIGFAPEKWVEEVKSIANYEDDSSAQGRFDAWTFAWRIALENPLTGGGFQCFRDGALFMQLVPDAIKARAFHSIYFEMLGSHGFVGLSLFLALMLASWWSFGRTRARCTGQPHLEWAGDLAAMGQVSLAGFAVAGAFLNLAFFDLFYLIIALSSLLSVVTQSEASAESTSPRPVRPWRTANVRRHPTGSSI